MSSGVGACCACAVSQVDPLPGLQEQGWHLKQQEELIIDCNVQDSGVFSGTVRDSLDP